MTSWRTSARSSASIGRRRAGARRCEQPRDLGLDVERRLAALLAPVGFASSIWRTSAAWIAGSTAAPGRAVRGGGSSCSIAKRPLPIESQAAGDAAKQKAGDRRRDAVISSSTVPL